MCLNLSGLLMRSIAIDSGTVNTLVAVKGRGIVLREPSAVAQMIAVFSLSTMFTVVGCTS